MRVLVTGGAGFIGSHIVELLVAEGDEVLVVDDLSTGKPDNLPRDVHLHEVDICDSRLVELAADFRPQAISHCAAQKSVPESVARPARDAEINIVGGVNVCQAAIVSGCTQLIYISTGGALYGSPDHLPCDEEQPIRPISPYALSKYTLERYLDLVLPSTVASKVLRLANVYGPRQDPEGEAGVVAIFGQRMLSGEPVTIFGDGEQTRDFVFAGDVVAAHELARRSLEPLTVNVGSGVGTTVNQIFRIMADETGYTLPPMYEDQREGDVRHIVLDCSRARDRLGWSAETTLQDGLRQTLDSLRGNR